MTDFMENLVYAKDEVIKFPTGIPGFEKNHEFILVQLQDYAPFEWLVCVDGTKLRFAIINPMLFRPDYSPNIMKEQLENLKIKKPEDILLYTIVTIKENPAESTANFLGPIIINKTMHIGKQVIIDDERYSTKEFILRKK